MSEQTNGRGEVREERQGEEHEEQAKRTLSVPQLPESIRLQTEGHVIVCESSLLLEEMLLEDNLPPLSPMPHSRPRLGSSGSASAAASAASKLVRSSPSFLISPLVASGVFDGAD